MAASTASAYTNSRASNSGKFSRIEMVRASTLPERYRSRLADLMEQFNFTGDELWMATDSCRIAIGKICFRRKPGTITRVRKGREEKCELGPCDVISRRSVQRLLYELVNVFQVLEVVYEANQWVPYGGDVVFRHSRTYRLRAEKLTPRPTFKEWRMQQKAAHSVTTFPRKPAQPAQEPLPPAPAAPVPVRSKPAAEHSHRSTERSNAPAKMTKREVAKFVADMAFYMRGQTSKIQLDGFEVKFQAGDPRYLAPMKWRDALAAVCRDWKRTPESVIDALKFWGYTVETDANSS